MRDQNLHEYHKYNDLEILPKGGKRNSINVPRGLDNEELANEFHKIENNNNNPVSLHNIWDGDLAEMQFVSKFNIENVVI